MDHFFCVGDHVILAADYELYGNASNGPLKPGDVGFLVSSDIENGLVRACVEVSESKWFYDKRALRRAPEKGELEPVLTGMQALSVGTAASSPEKGGVGAGAAAGSLPPPPAGARAAASPEEKRVGAGPAAEPNLTPEASAAKELFDAASEDDQSLLKKYIATGVNVDEYRDKWGRTALICASQKGHTTTVELLIKAKAHKEAKNKRGCTALVMAAWNGRTETVRALLKARAYKNTKSKTGDTALIEAAQSGHTATVQVLLEAGADKEITNNDGKSALDYANANGYTAIVALL